MIFIEKNGMAEKRNYGVDGLRILAMYMVVLLHMMGHGGILAQAAGDGVKHAVAKYLDTAAYCAVNCYALISGYVGVKRRFKWSRILSLWLQVAFYGVSIVCVLGMLRPGVIPRHAWIQGMIPVSNRNYWYYTAYFAMSFFIPFMNAILSSVSTKELRVALIAAVCLFSTYPTILQTDRFWMVNGHSVWWLIILYFIGGYFRLYGNGSRIIDTLKKHGIYVYVCATTIVWISQILIADREIPYFFGGALQQAFLFRYDSPLVLLQACALLLWSAERKVTERIGKYIGAIAPLTFGVYLIHEHPLVREELMTASFSWIGRCEAFIIPFAVIGVCLSVFALCILIESMRLRVFRWFKVKEICQHIFESFGLS